MYQTLEETLYTYNTSHSYDYDLFMNTDLNMNNRLLCTFTSLGDLDNLIGGLSNKYDILYNKMFVLHIKSNNEYVVTYNIDQGNVTDIPDNTILVHRKKEFNVLYTINSLNELIKRLNGGVVDPKFPIDWQHYKNSILLTQEGQIKTLQTRIYKIIEI